MQKQIRAALYARFSSDNQRTESIDAQVRAMRQYCEDHDWQVAEIYIDEALSGTSDRRPAFQKMIADSEKKGFEIVLVHKLDRFCRNRYDSANYKYRLRKNGVRLCSVLERLDDSPESIILEALLEGMAEYYSSNLAREVMKGLKENALHCRHTGGQPPLGYDLDTDQKLIINSREAEIVRLIYEMYINGYGNIEMVNILNQGGYTNKKGKPFSRFSFQTILQNEKYIGVYVYNRREGKDASHRRNGSREKTEEEIIKVEGGCPAIISKEVFRKAQEIRKQNRRQAGQFFTKHFYLCSGIIVCGCCHHNMYGSVRYGNQPFAEYMCPMPKAVCGNIKEIDQKSLDAFVVQLLRKKLFNEKSMRGAVDHVNRIIRTDNLDAEPVAYEVLEEDYLLLQELENQNPKFRSLVRKYINKIIIDRDTVTIRMDMGLGRIEHYKEYTYRRDRFLTPTQSSKRKRRKAREIQKK